MHDDTSKCLVDKIGFVNKEQLNQYKDILQAGDIVSKYSRMLDSCCGSLTFAYLAVVGDAKHNDLLSESFKAFRNKFYGLLDEMVGELNALKVKDTALQEKPKEGAGAEEK